MKSKDELGKMFAAHDKRLIFFIDKVLTQSTKSKKGSVIQTKNEQRA